jgi:hypothetical protein
MILEIIINNTRHFQKQNTYKMQAFHSISVPTNTNLVGGFPIQGMNNIHMV